MSVAILWFRRDLRLDDNAALTAALRAADAIVPVFVLDDHDLHVDVSPARLSMLRDSLRDLEGQLAAVGSRLIVRNGPPHEALVSLAREVGASHVFAHRDREPYARRRDERVREALECARVRLVLSEDLLVVPPGDVLTEKGAPFTTFTPFFRRWLEVDKPVPLPRPALVPSPDGVRTGTLESVPLARPGAFSIEAPPRRSSGLAARETAPPALRGGSAEAQRLWADFREDGLARYAERRDRPDLPGTSRLAAHLRLGTMGARRLLAEAREAARESPPPVRGRSSEPADGRGAEAFIRELAFREFYGHVLAHFPHVAGGIDGPPACFQKRMESFPWLGGEEADARFEAWSQGRTGYPIVDAGMRQLRQEGFVHNRVRMIVASFLTKDLLVDWRRGEAYFRAALADGDVASNNAGWQWSAGCGTDAQPFFRIFNPVLQGERFDPAGDYVRRYVPQLAGVPGPAVHAPWRLSRPPGDYARPLVEHAAARRRALALFSGFAARQREGATATTGSGLTAPRRVSP